MQRTVLAESVLGDGRLLRLATAEAADAQAISEVILDAFSNRPKVIPPPPALNETPESVQTALARGFGVLALVDDEPAGVIIVSIDGALAGIHRVSVRPSFQRLGIASVMVTVVLEALALQSVQSVELVARTEFPAVVAWWHRHGFNETARTGTSLTLARQLPVCVQTATAEDTQALGRRLAGLVRAGDVLIAAGDLGAGKTTLAQGLGAGLDVSGPVISPTFVLSRVHPPNGTGPALVHVDAYRLGTAAELDDLDLDASTQESVTLVEWGTGVAEGLSTDRLEIDIRRSLDPADETRWIFLTPVGERWANLRAELEAK
ncbi:tRNA (adenosine(37)-N6)-threonylcarbamoyltransferase complex ATPase subunit type 1 TsaE [Propionicimonas sp.]|uniref:tRNA (adenosine(37)-N6)-threonylcarbamoyltransferase complex ATPase subunit type 1 TsaE n=1 Tax=Propionicimonas sp. TaxID=1955623 RepID=UPI00180F84FF|nr:tRNA (adenosine(37)-N6)-threonylcarbamoyltransferase complex ATPase subunit type 1 TsaE [Propionicimonas sp.]MBU3976983.1 tRNA (adenosine(37)-N6)-threonylcarbamoyltransferase complex ATPase subunit type 1 TsaE [Actinomycetota bacterium]MBA3020554.1 tRNA (adenosine(37)-N6)-threonylcarbamoyltransferase complex ATPase subunit type 1 TsaE [Propionicimonas sp.]MBU3986728.1 tRNA (adenosine(37)-N6)-threonylcarbamoyltransferase complex ATPase subunit type 1 TsaE [Actinomycetota bacterium]MBU4007120.